jgi:hypothetical protein
VGSSTFYLVSILKKCQRERARQIAFFGSETDEKTIAEHVTQQGAPKKKNCRHSEE